MGCLRDVFIVDYRWMFDSKRRLMLGIFALTAFFGVFFIENRATVADFDLRAPFWRHSVSREALWLPVLSSDLGAARKFRQPFHLLLFGAALHECASENFGAGNERATNAE